MHRNATAILGLALLAMACSSAGAVDTGVGGWAGGGGNGTDPTGGGGGRDDGRGGAGATGNGGNVGGRDATGAGGSAAGAAGGAPTGGTGTGVCGARQGQLFGADYPWNQKIDQAPLDSESAAIVGYLQANHTGSAKFRIDGPSDEVDSLYGIVVLTADGSAPHQSFQPSDDFYSPDCDPAAPPIPSGGAIEGETSYACTNDGDCHLIVVDTGECRLFEMWRTDRTASAFHGGCLAVWNLTAPYTSTLRGDCCTSADAAGLPIAAHMFSADEIAAGEIAHAIRFILPNSLMRSHVYVRPATHSTGATSGPASAPPYGARMRLKASFDDSKLNAAARVVARALKQYGMILSDGGNLTFTAANDRFTTHKWRDVGLSPGDLTSLQWSDFEVPELGTRFQWNDSCECQRTPITK